MPIKRVLKAREGIDALWLSQFTHQQNASLIFIAENEQRAIQMGDMLPFFDPNINIITLPAWDCLPFDRNSPSPKIQAQRMMALGQIQNINAPTIIITTISGFLQRFAQQDYPILSLELNQEIAFNDVVRFCEDQGYLRCDSVQDIGEYAVRGGIIDIFSANYDDAIRIDFFGDQIDDMRFFDVISQQTHNKEKIQNIELSAVMELSLTADKCQQFRQQYRHIFGAMGEKDALFTAICNGIRYQGCEHYLPLFYDDMQLLSDILPDAMMVFDYDHDQSIATRWAMIDDHFYARNEALQSGDDDYRAIAIEKLYVTEHEWQELQQICQIYALSRFDLDMNNDDIRVDNKACEDFSLARKSPDIRLFDALLARVENDAKHKHAIACNSLSARDRLFKRLSEDGQLTPIICDDWQSLLKQKKKVNQINIYLFVLPIKKGFITKNLIIYSDGDLLGEGVTRVISKKRKTGQYILNAQELNIGDIIVHNDHGIGRYEGLEIIEVEKIMRECLRLAYHGDEYLFVPVENIEMISRFGNDSQANITLDRLGLPAWQERKAKVKEKIQEIAEDLLRTAAKRSMQKGTVIDHNHDAYQEFCAGFGFAETDDQLHAINDVMADLSSGQPMDRLICGDVGYGKTEIAMRAAFAVASQGAQVAVIVPTTLLARQHYERFQERFANFPIEIGMLSRLVNAKKAKQTRQDLADGKIDIIIGTHALLSQKVIFQQLQLVVIDEEQHFGVKQKERLKEMRHHVHILSMSATPIPRTLHMALSGVRQLSIIAHAPVDRLPIRSFVMNFDSLILKEAIKRELFRAGRVYYVCPHIADLAHVEEQIRKMLPDIRMARAHGGMNGTELEHVMSGFEQGRFDVLLSTNIVESGLDIGNANTMIIHRADMFGLSRLYQLRGRVGRGKQRGYCYFLYPKNRFISPQATRRLEAIANLDGLGGGFSIASQDMDIRGAGNLVGAEQSGHIKEIGVELYQKMLEEAMNNLKELGNDYTSQDYIPYYDWAPQLNLGVSVMIPEQYIESLAIRMDCYRRLSQCEQPDHIDAFAVEMQDRFGTVPLPMENLFSVIKIKIDCRLAGIEKLDIGAKGALISFRNNHFCNPEGLVKLLNQQGDKMKLRHDHKLFFARNWKSGDVRIKGASDIAKALAKLAQK